VNVLSLLHIILKLEVKVAGAYKFDSVDVSVFEGVAFEFGAGNDPQEVLRLELVSSEIPSIEPVPPQDFEFDDRVEVQVVGRRVAARRVGGRRRRKRRVEVVFFV